jgi:hypothetical protein
MRSGKIFLSLANSPKGTKSSGIKSIHPGLGQRETQIGKGFRPFFISRPKQQGSNFFIWTKGWKPETCNGVGSGKSRAGCPAPGIEAHYKFPQIVFFLMSQTQRKNKSGEQRDPLFSGLYPKRFFRACSELDLLIGF